MSDRGERRRPDQEKLQEQEEVKRKGVPKTEQGGCGSGWGSVRTGCGSGGRGRRGRGRGHRRPGGLLTLETQDFREVEGPISNPKGFHQNEGLDFTLWRIFSVERDQV